MLTAINQLNDTQRVAFLMHRIDGKKYSEIAEELNISIKAVEKRIHLALLELRKEFKHFSRVNYYVTVLRYIMHENMEENYTLAKWLNNEMTPTELAEFEASSDFAIYDKIRKYSGELKTTSFNEERILKTILTTKKQASKTIPLYNQWFFKVASMLVLFVAIGYFLNTRLPENKLAGKGQKTTFSLPDNSEVVLNADSEIEYKKSNWDNNRKLKLKGEAYFKVAKGKTFEVETN